MDINRIIIIFLLVIAVVLAALWLYRFFEGKNAAKDISEEEFSQDIRRKQVIDLREADDFNHSHILGARNIPMSQLKLRIEELRRDKAVYLYADSSSVARQASAVLKKAGYQPIYRLDGGYDSWHGRIKKKK